MINETPDFWGVTELKNLLIYETIRQLYINYEMINLVKYKKIYFKYITLKKAQSHIIKDENIGFNPDMSDISVDIFI